VVRDIRQMLGGLPRVVKAGWAFGLGTSSDTAVLAPEGHPDKLLRLEHVNVSILRPIETTNPLAASSFQWPLRYG
jgi:hypothetical protein